MKVLIIIVLISLFLFSIRVSYAQNSTSCTGLGLEFVNHGSSYTVGETITYKYSCTPGGYASYVEIQVLKPDGTATTYNSGSNIDTSTLGFDTSNLAAGNYVLRACFNQNCQPSVTASLPFTLTVADSPSSITLALNPSTQYSGLMTNISVTITDDKGISSASWKGDRFFESGQSIPCSGTSCSYNNPLSSIPGAYTITVTATDSSGQTSTKTASGSFTACSSDSQCGGITFIGARSCSMDRVVQTREARLCTTYSSCSYESSGSYVIEDCSSSGKTCSQSSGTAQCSSVPTCTDSDGNGAYQTKGTVTLTYSNGTTETKTDYCEGSTTIDYYCSGTYTGSPSVLIDMKIGKGDYNLGSVCSCYDGACTSPSGNIITPTPQSNYTYPPTQSILPTQSQGPGSTTAPLASIPPQEGCGNGICNYWESASNCPQDCRIGETPYPTYIPPSKPSTVCNTDKDCSWLITNSCPETAGALWACGSINEQLIKNPNPICSGTLSPKPPVNCGCIQNTCSVFEKEKPKEPPKKIGNTEVDTTTLLSAVIQMEQLKVKFDFLKSAMVKLSKYYNLTGKSDPASRWLDASRMMDNVIFRLESLKVGIRSKISTFNIDDLRQLKKDVKAIIGTLRDVVKVILGESVPISTQPTQSPLTGQPRSPTNQTNATTPSIGGGFGQGNSTNRTNSTS